MNMVNVAKGSGDAYVEYGLHIWDFAASGVILIEAGGAMIDPAGKYLGLNLTRSVGGILLEAGGAMIDPAGEVLLFTTSGGILKRLIVL